MFKRDYQELRVGRIPTGHAVLEAEAVETHTAEQVGELALADMVDESPKITEE